MQHSDLQTMKMLQKITKTSDANTATLSRALKEILNRQSQLGHYSGQPQGRQQEEEKKKVKINIKMQAKGHEVPNQPDSSILEFSSTTVSIRPLDP